MNGVSHQMMVGAVNFQGTLLEMFLLIPEV